MKKGKIIILSGPSGSGKTTIYKRLLASPKLKNKLAKSLSVTTRPKRPGEVQGRDYDFVSRKMFLYKKRAGHFIESQKVFDNHYGTPRKNVSDIIKEGKNVLLCIDVKGAKVVHHKFPKAVTIFLKVPSIEVLKERLKKRGSETEEALQLRLKTAVEEMKEAQYYNHVVFNDRLSDAYSRVQRIIESTLQS